MSYELFFIFSLFFGIYPASPMDKLLSAVYLISSEWDMLQCVQFLTVVGFVDIQSYEQSPGGATTQPNKSQSQANDKQPFNKLLKKYFSTIHTTHTSPLQFYHKWIILQM